jgi:hypothetical protein
MYNYTYNVSYLNIEGDASDTAYRRDFLGVNNVSDWSVDTIIKNQDAIYEKFKDNEQFQSILTKGKEKYQSTMPIMMDNCSVLVLLFEYNSFEYFHKCLKDLFNNNEITDDNLTQMNNLLS